MYYYYCLIQNRMSLSSTCFDRVLQCYGIFYEYKIKNYTLRQSIYFLPLNIIKPIYAGDSSTLQFEYENEVFPKFKRMTIRFVLKKYLSAIKYILFLCIYETCYNNVKYTHICLQKMSLNS